MEPWQAGIYAQPTGKTVASSRRTLIRHSIHTQGQEILVSTAH